MNPTGQHPGLTFKVGDIVTPVRRYHPIILRSEHDDMFPNWGTCPVWDTNTSGIIIEIKIDYNNVGEIMFKLVTPSGIGWVDWWSINRS